MTQEAESRVCSLTRQSRCFSYQVTLRFKKLKYLPIVSLCDTIGKNLGILMILSFKHKGLEKFFTTGSKAGIQASHAPKLGRILARLNSTKEVNDMNLPGWDLHPLVGSLKDHWSVKVNGNWRVTFKIENGHAEIVDYQDYH